MILTLDIGTTNLKTGIFRNGKLLHVSRQSIDIIDDCFVDPNQWYEAFTKCIIELSEKTDLSNLRAAILDGNGPTLVPVPETKASLWLDRSAEAESQFISSKLGYFIDSSFFLPKILKMKKESIISYNKTNKFFTCADYFAWRLTGVERTVMPLEGLEKFYWNKQVLKLLELDEEKFAPFIEMGQVIGKISPIISKTLGIPEIPLLAGPPDFVTSILGSGAVFPGLVCDRSGTSEGLNFCTSEKKEDKRLMCYKHPNGEDWNISGIISTTGKAIQWIKNLMGYENLNFKDFYEIVQKSPPGSNGIVFHPYLNGERAPIWDSNARASFFNIGLTSQKEDYARSVCEGICFAIKDVIQVIDRPFNEVRVTGGPSHSDFLNQLKADILGVPVVTISSEEPDLMGLAVLGYTALGDYDSIKDCCKALIRIKKTYFPNEKLNQIYQNNFNLYKKKQEEMNYGNWNTN